MKTTGKQWNEFTSSKKYWPDPDVTHTENEIIKRNGVLCDDENESDEQIRDDDIIEIVDGYMEGAVLGPKNQTLAQYFRRWLKEQNTVTLIVTCYRSQEDAVRNAVKAEGGKIS